MALLLIKSRQRYLKKVGFYTGKIDGIEGKATKEAYLKLQKKYFTRSKDKDGEYGPKTDILLKNVYYMSDYKYFDIKEFKCACGGKYCTGYPSTVNRDLLDILTKVRTKYGPLTITSGLRCKAYNNTLKGSIPTSKHIIGRAADFKFKGSTDEKTRDDVIKYMRTQPKFKYAYHNSRGAHKNMGSAIHIDV